MRKLYQTIEHFAINGPGIKDESLAQQWQQTQRLAPAQMLQVLREITTGNGSYLQFDHLGFYMCSIDLIDRASTALPEKSKGLSSRKIAGKLTYERVYYEVLWDATGIETRELDPTRSIPSTIGHTTD